MRGNALERHVVVPHALVLQAVATGGRPVNLDVVAFLKYAHEHRALTLVLPWVCQILACFAFDARVPFLAECAATLTTILAFASIYLNFVYILFLEQKETPPTELLTDLFLCVCRSISMQCTDASSVNDLCNKAFHVEVIGELFALWKQPFPSSVLLDDNSIVQTPSLDSVLVVGLGLLESCSSFVGEMRQDLQSFLRCTQTLDDMPHFVSRKRLAPSAVLPHKGASSLPRSHLGEKTSGLDAASGSLLSRTGAPSEIDGVLSDRWGKYRTSADITLVQAEVRRFVIFNTL